MINLTGPFVTLDPRTAKERADRLATLIGGDNPPSNIVARTPWLGVPILTETAGWADHDRKMWLFDRPETWLPDEIRRHGRGETPGAYALRVGYAMLVMDLMDVGEDNEWHGVRMNVDMGRVDALSDWHDLGEPDAMCDRIAVDVRQRAEHAFDGAYDRKFWLDWARGMETSIMLGTPVLAAATVIDLSRDGGGDDALPLLQTLPYAWGDMFTPDSLTPDGVDMWVERNRDRATVMIHRLVANGLEQAETLKAWEAWK